jgi:hypothetical protein
MGFLHVSYRLIGAMMTLDFEGSEEYGARNLCKGLTPRLRRFVSLDAVFQSPPRDVGGRLLLVDLSRCRQP